VSEGLGLRRGTLFAQGEREKGRLFE